jgi:hypothetical protein
MLFCVYILPEYYPRVLQDVASEHAEVREHRMATPDRVLPLAQNLLRLMVVLGQGLASSL